MAAAQAVDPGLRSLLWRVVGRAAFRASFHNWYRLRREILRLFGAHIALSAKFRRTADIDRPWNLTAGERVLVGDHSAFRARAPIHIGDRCTISQLATISTEMRDPTQPLSPIISAPILIEDDCWVAADALVMPGSTLRQGAVVGARSLAQGELAPWTVAAGQPAIGLRTRRLRSQSATKS